MDIDFDRSIAALASPPGGAQRGIVRISGGDARGVLADWFEPDESVAWNSAKSAASHFGKLRLTGDPFETHVRVQVLFWPNQKSYTGQPLIELHLPGSPCLLEAVLGEVYRRGARPARPGEFTLRAFLAGKLDLLQAEAVLGVIDAQSHVELQTALSQLAGGVSGRLTELRRDLLELLADLEAGLDFVEEDIEFVSRSDVLERLRNAHMFVDDLVRQTNDRMQARTRQKVVLAGLPNAGKSTLFNRLAGSNAALVSPELGTTRDFLIRSVSSGGWEFDLVDTAGFECQPIGIAATAQQQRESEMDKSDLLVWCSSASLNGPELQLDDQLFGAVQGRSRAVIRVQTKSDLVPQQKTVESSKVLNESTNESMGNVLSVSVRADRGLTEFLALLRCHFNSDQFGNGQWLGMTAARCRETLEQVAGSLDRARQAAQTLGAGDELIAVDLRDALDQLGVVLGVIYTDDILDRVFSKFCIGK